MLLETPVATEKTVENVDSTSFTVNFDDLGYYLMVPVDASIEKENGAAYPRIYCISYFHYS